MNGHASVNSFWQPSKDKINKLAQYLEKKNKLFKEKKN
jgi:hypothetical protein